MSQFPSLIPSTRLYTPGDVASAIQNSLSGVLTGFRRGGRKINQTLSLSFQKLEESDVTLIRNHFDGINGGFNTFFLSAEIWNGYAAPPVPLVSNYAWRYSAPPVISDSSCGRWDVEVELQSVPIESGDLIYDGGSAAAAPARTYILDALLAPALPEREFVISPTGAV